VPAWNYFLKEVLPILVLCFLFLNLRRNQAGKGVGLIVSTAVRVIIKLSTAPFFVQVNQVFSPTVTQLNLDKMAPKFRVRTILNLDRLPNLTTLVLALSTPKVRFRFILKVHCISFRLNLPFKYSKPCCCLLYLLTLLWKR
jgi:hypothetical protein